MGRIADRFEAELPDGTVELVDQRTIGCKVYSLGERERRAVAAVGSIHVPDDVLKWGRGEEVDWQDIDTDFEADEKGGYRVRSAWYGLEVRPDVVGYSYLSKRAGSVTVALEALDGKPVESLPQPVLRGSEIWWEGVKPGLDIFIRCAPASVEIFKKLHDENASRSFTWIVDETDPPVLMLKTNTAGHDNADFAEPERMRLGGGRTRRHLEMQHTEEELVAPVGRRRRRATETWTGRTFHYDKTRGPDGESVIARTPVYTNDAVYPVLIDQDISESVAANGDDGYQNTTTWFLSYGATTHTYLGTNPYRPGFRFQTVAVPAGATIDLANLVCEVPSTAGGATSCPIFGNDTDDAPAWGNNAGPDEMTPTTASASFAVPDPAGAFSTNVTTIIAEIVARAGWASGNDIALGCRGVVSGSFKYIEDVAGAGGGFTAAVLQIDYTEAGGGGSILPLIAKDMRNLDDMHGMRG